MHGLRMTALAAIGAVILAGACSPEEEEVDGADAPATAAAGFSPVRAGGIVLAVPEEWQIEEPDVRVPGAILVASLPDPAAGQPPLVAVYAEDGFEGTIDDYLFTFNAESATALPDRRVLEETRASVPGAEGAVLIESRYALPAEVDVVIRQLDLLIVAPGGRTVDVRASAPAEPFGSLRATFQRVLDSVVVEGADAGEEEGEEDDGS